MSVTRPAWIWNLVGQRWSEAEHVTAFFHAGEHLYAPNNAAEPERPPTTTSPAQRWPHRLRHGSTDKLVKELQELPEPEGKAAEQVRREKGYFAGHQARLCYRERALRGPVRTGAVELARRSLQCRFKRIGQFRSRDRPRHLCALREARLNRHKDKSGSGLLPPSHNEKMRQLQRANHSWISALAHLGDNDQYFTPVVSLVCLLCEIQFRFSTYE